MFGTYESEVKCKTCGYDCCFDVHSEIASIRREKKNHEKSVIGLVHDTSVCFETCDCATCTWYGRSNLCRKLAGCHNLHPYLLSIYYV